MVLRTERYELEQRDFVLTMDPAGGVVPVTISVPHDTLDGLELEGLVSWRQGGVINRDRRVWPLARDVALAYPVQVVRGLLPRTVCDYNRASDQAFEALELEPLWAAYHGAIRARLEAAKYQYGQALLLDLHGYAQQPSYGDYDVILGTLNRMTVTTTVDQELGVWLRKAGYRVFVPASEPVRAGVSDWLNGQYTVEAGAAELGCDAIQIEIFRRFRLPGAREEGKELAVCIAGFLAKYFG
jgi:N-formylglutamate amidohydrolase